MFLLTFPQRIFFNYIFVLESSVLLGEVTLSHLIPHMCSWQSEIFYFNAQHHYTSMFWWLLLFLLGLYSPFVAYPPLEATFHTSCLRSPAKARVGDVYVQMSGLNDGEEAFIKRLAHVRDRMGDSINLKSSSL